MSGYGKIARRSLPLFCLLAQTGFGQVVLSLESGTAAPGSTVLMNLTLNTGTTVVAGLQWTLQYSPSDISGIQAAISSAAESAGGLLACANQTGSMKCLLVNPSGLGASIPSGVAAVVSVTVAPTISSSSSEISLSAIEGTSPNAQLISIQGNGAVLTIEGATSARTALGFVPVTPCRVADTRNANGAFGGPAIQGQTSRNFAVPSGSCGIPSTAAAYSLNVAVIPQGKTLGYLTVWAAGQLQPMVATLNSLDGRIKSNAAIVPAGAGGAISVYATDTTDVTLDINGYFVPVADNAALAFYPVMPCRIADTRKAAGPLGGPGLASNATRSFPIVGSCGIPANAQAYSLNFTALPNGALGYLTVWPTGQTQPEVASLNAVTGTTTANAVIVQAGGNGSVEVFAESATDVLIDTNGYFAAPASGGLSLYNLVPCRVLDTRQSGAEPFTGAQNVNVSATCGVSSAAQAYVLNATVVPAAILDFLAIWPEGEPQPDVSTLNAYDGAITSNMAIVPTSNGSITAFSSNATQLVLDIFGYFGP